MSEKRKMPAKEIAKRYVLFVISLFICAVGVAATKKAALGVSPTSSIANVLSLRFTFLSLGNWLIIYNCALIVGQILILRKKFQLIQLLQVPLSFLFGYFTDFGMWLFSSFDAEEYLPRLGMVLLGTFLLGFGVSLAVMANVIMNSAEAFVKAISDTTRKDFGTLKIAFDICCVVIAVALSFIFFGTIGETREGTLIAAILTGLVVKLFVKLLGEKTEKILIK